MVEYLLAGERVSFSCGVVERNERFGAAGTVSPLLFVEAVQSELSTSTSWLPRVVRFRSRVGEISIKVAKPPSSKGIRFI